MPQISFPKTFNTTEEIFFCSSESAVIQRSSTLKEQIDVHHQPVIICSVKCGSCSITTEDTGNHRQFSLEQEKAMVTNVLQPEISFELPQSRSTRKTSVNQCNLRSYYVWPLFFYICRCQRNSETLLSIQRWRNIALYTLCSFWLKILLTVLHRFPSHLRSSVSHISSLGSSIAKEREEMIRIGELAAGKVLSDKTNYRVEFVWFPHYRSFLLSLHYSLDTNEGILTRPINYTFQNKLDHFISICW